MNESLEITNVIVSIIAGIATALGFPIAIYVLWSERKKSIRQAENETYLELQNRYSTFLQLCMENSDLQMHAYGYPRTPLDSSQQVRRLYLFDILVSMFESAHFLYENSGTNTLKERQLSGWTEYIIYWLNYADFREAWKRDLSAQYDSKFLRFMNDLVAKIEASAESGHNK